MAKALTVERFFAWCAQLPAGCMVAMEACGGAHHVARRLAAMAEPVVAPLARHHMTQ